MCSNYLIEIEQVFYYVLLGGVGGVAGGVAGGGWRLVG
tara:strand:- start:183 stop:296 length:114 start_codon:yes stop_codon:yes gene_type:complete